MWTFWRDFRRNRLAVAGMVFILFFIISALLAPLIAPHNPLRGDLSNRLKPPVWMEGGDWRHPFGCDQQGRDILSRILYGARLSILFRRANFGRLAPEDLADADGPGIETQGAAIQVNSAYHTSLVENPDPET